MSRLKEIAKFFCGATAFDALFHLYLWLSGTTFVALGITLTPTWNLVSALAHAAVSLLLGYYAWGGRAGRVMHA